MASAKQINANRRNATLSTGPKTPSGKERASQNAVTHGLLSRSPVLRDEDPAAFERFVDDIASSLRPFGEAQRTLARQVGELWWRLRRMALIEAGMLNGAQSDADAQSVRQEIGELERAARLDALARRVFPNEAAALIRHEGMRQLRAGTATELQEIEAAANERDDVALARAYRAIEDALAKLSRYEKSLHRQALSALAALVALQRLGTDAKQADILAER